MGFPFKLGLVPGITGGASESYYWTFKGSSLSDHGYISKQTRGVNAGMANFGTKYTETFTTKVSNVTSAVDRTVEKVVSGNFGAGSAGFKSESKLLIHIFQVN